MAATGRSRFYFVMALVIAGLSFAGFARTYYLKAVFAAPALPTLTHVHGLAFTAWVVLLVTQTLLVGRDRVDLHRRLGWAGVGLAAAMIVLGVMMAFATARRDIAAGRPHDAMAFFIIPLGDIVIFAALVALAIYERARPAYHRRLMLLATLAILLAPIGRLPGLTADGIVIVNFLAILAVAPTYEWWTRGRPHPLSLWGGVIVFSWAIGRYLVSETPAWLGVASWMLG